MINKIIGFYFGKKVIDKQQIDVFGVNLSFTHHKLDNVNLYFWGLGDLGACLVEGKYSFSFPLSSDLHDRNLLIEVKSNSIVVENDWLGSIPVFFNQNTQAASTLSLLVNEEPELSEEGLLNYLRFGYSILGKTPFSDTSFLRYFSRLTLSFNSVVEEHRRDPIEAYKLREDQSPDVVIATVKEVLDQIKKSVPGQLIVPTSGGYDSRLLCKLLDEPRRTFSFSYGVSCIQQESHEVIFAKSLTTRLKLPWKQIELSQFNKYIPSWFTLYGISTHLHGMYQIEFYQGIREYLTERRQLDGNSCVISGIVGDIWAGSINAIKIVTQTDVDKLGYSHGININKSHILINNKSNLLTNFWFCDKQKLQSAPLQNLATIRLKMILLSYLLAIPEYCGIASATPFLNMKVALSMLELPVHLRTNRTWQKSYFSQHDLDLESDLENIHREVSLDFYSARHARFEAIDYRLLSGWLDMRFLKKINYALVYFKWFYWYKGYLMRRPRVARLLKAFHLKDDFGDLLNAYYIIKPVEMALKR